MAKYRRSYLEHSIKPRAWLIHPIWRGIGFLFMTLFPVMAYAGAVVLVRKNFEQHWLDLPTELLKSFVIPYLGRVYYADLVTALIILIFGFGLLTIVYGLLIRIIGFPRYGPFDVPSNQVHKGQR